MSGAQPTYEWDIFISYARADRRKDSRADWIERFKNDLVHEVSFRAGRQLDVYFDVEAQRFNEPVETILEKVRRSKLLLAIGSPNFANSKWCADEANAFAEVDREENRTFAIELSPLTGRMVYPGNVGDLNRALFWYEDGKVQLTMTTREKQYRKAVAKLAEEICEALASMDVADGAAGAPGNYAKAAPSAASGGTAGRSSTPSPAAPGAGSGSNAVVIAFASDDVYAERQDLINYLKGWGVEVLDLDQEVPRQADSLRSTLERTLPKARLYVQLLARGKGRGLQGSELSATELQLNLAEAHLVPTDIFVWRPADIDPEGNPDESYKPLLRRAGNWSIPELARAIRDRLNTPPPGPPVPDDMPVLVISADPEDEDFAGQLALACRGRRCEAMVDNCDLNDERRRMWADATVVAFVQARADRGNLMARYRIFNRERASSGAPKGLKRQAVVYGPPPPKKPGTIVAPLLDDIDISTEPNVTKFESWLDTIGAHRQ